MEHYDRSKAASRSQRGDHLRVTNGWCGEPFGVVSLEDYYSLIETNAIDAFPDHKGNLEVLAFGRPITVEGVETDEAIKIDALYSIEKETDGRLRDFEITDRLYEARDRSLKNLVNYLLFAAIAMLAIPVLAGISAAFG